MNDILFRDTLLNMLLGMVGATTILLLAVVVVLKTTDESAPSPGNLAITACWPEGQIDIDLWAQAPGDPKPVGFSNRGSKTLNLLRDDLGTSNDLMPVNCENVFSRGLPDGEYVMNLHYYKGKQTPVTVTVEIRVGDTGGNSQKSIEKTVSLVSEGQEITVVRFKLRGGKIDPASVNHVYYPLRAAK